MTSERDSVKRDSVRLLAAAVIAATGLVSWWGGDLQAQVRRDEGKAAIGKLPPHAETTFAHELMRLNQVSVIRAEADAAKDAAAPMWKAELIAANFEEYSKSRADQAAAVKQYVEDMKKYLDGIDARSTGGVHVEAVDGFWAMDHVRFVFGDLSKAIITRMEYFGANRKDREDLAPIAALSERLLTFADEGLKAICAAEENKKPFNDSETGPWMRAYSEQAAVRYYQPFAGYFQAMALDPAGPQAAKRRELLNKAAESLKEWIEPEDARASGVKNMALLLRGKVYSELGKYPEALKDLADAPKAENAPENTQPPGWVGFQAKYQTVVTKARAQDFPGAESELTQLRKMVPPEQKEGQIALDLLGFRVSWLEALAQPSGKQKDAKLKAMKVLSGTMEKDPKARDLVFEQLVSQTTEAEEKSGDLMPLQSLALAWGKAQQAKNASATDKTDLLMGAIKQCDAIRKNASSTESEKLEATWLAAMCYGEMKDWENAVRYDLDFVEASPRDPRSKGVLDLALAQLGEIRKAAGDKGFSPQVQEQADRALKLAVNKGDVRWGYTYGMMLIRKKTPESLKEAAQVFAKIDASDKNYMDAQFQILRASFLRVQLLSDHKGDPQQLKDAARDLVGACDRYLALLDNPPANVPKDQVETAKKNYQVDLWLMEVGTALSPLGDGNLALKRLDQLEKPEVLNTLDSEKQGAILRYRIRAYELAGQPEKAIQVVFDYTERFPDRATSVIQGLISSSMEEIERAEKANDAPRAKKLSEGLVGLLGKLVEVTRDKEDKETDAAKKAKLHKDVYAYRQLQGQMMIKAGQSDKAIDLFLALEKEAQKEGRYDIYNRIQVAHAHFAAGKYGYAQEKYAELIPQLKLGGDMYWECYLRMIRCNEELIKTDTPELKAKHEADTKKVLKDLKAAYGDQIGGKFLHEEFAALLSKWGLAGS